MKKLYLGTTNLAKLNAVCEVFKDFEVIPFSVDSGVNKQPLSEEETIKGALNRAMALPSEGYRLGLEAGVEIINDVCFLINFGALVDEQNEVYYAGGSFLPLPKEIKDELYNNHLELKEVMNKYSTTNDLSNHGGAISVFTCNEVERKDIFIHICKLLYGQLKFKESMKGNK